MTSLWTEKYSAKSQAGLTAYAALLRKWNPAINLVSPKTLDQIEDRHLRDSAQVFEVLPEDAQHLVDFGSGGGLPALVLAILADGESRALKTTMIESDKRKSAFLRTVALELGLTNAHVIADRVENVPNQGADIITARALAPLSQLLDYAAIHATLETRCFFLKGKQYRAEIDQAAQDHRFSYTVHPSITERGAALLEIGDVYHGA
ncbi:16S rRNA (guanine(527)-N(7))-methyltransferase RsmG [Paracoccaceae bacterium GXU_MW_L88]